MKRYLTKKEIQNEEVKMLNQLIKIMDFCNIKYSVYYGTLLGTIRHKGFIPWDDDIDIAILRKDYEKLIWFINNKKIPCEYIQHNLSFIGYELGNSDWPFIKTVNQDIIIHDDYNLDYNLWVDIFPLDNIPDDNTNFYNKVNFYKKLYFIKRIGIKKLKFDKFRHKLIYFMIKPISYNYIIKKLINSSKAYSKLNTKLIGNVVWDDKNVILRDKFIMSKRKFEDLYVQTVKDYDYILKKSYGEDYMVLPKKEDRITHSFEAERVVK